MVARPDQVSLGVLATTVTRAVVDEAITVCGVREKRSDGKLPAHVVAYLTMALCLFGDDDYEEVATKVTGSLSQWGSWNAGWSVPTASGISQARKRLGPNVMREVFERVARPVAPPVAGPVAVAHLSPWGGSWLRGRRLVAIDGFEADVPDSTANADEFGYAGGHSHSAFPKVRVVALAECGTHAFLAAEVGPCGVGERTLAAELLPRLQPDEVLVADRNFYSFRAWTHAADTGADLIWRAPTGLRLPILTVLPDGTFITALVDPRHRHGRASHVRLLADVRAGRPPDPAQVRLARVVEYDVPDRGNPDDRANDGHGHGARRADGTSDPAKDAGDATGDEVGELIVLLTTILDPAQADAEELADAYHQRWEHETAYDQLKTHLRGPGRVLRSRLPELVYQEVWAWLTVHHALSALIARAAQATRQDPDRISYTDTLRVVRRTATGTAPFPSGPLG
jgi:hypothetical protein